VILLLHVPVDTLENIPVFLLQVKSENFEPMLHWI